MRATLLKQAGFCILVILALFISKHSGISILEKGAETVMRHMTVNYTIEDVRAAAATGRSMAASAVGRAETAVAVITGKPVYGDPIDEADAQDEVPVYAVAGGQVTAVGENEEIGKYVVIVHGNQAESLYGNLYTVDVSAPCNVKKGQIIGIYQKSAGKDFYYSLKEKE